MQQGCGGINLQRRPDHDNGVGGFDQTNGFFYQRHGFAEPDDVRPQRSASAVAVGQGLVALPRQDFAFINRASELVQFTVQVQDFAAARAFVQVVYVLSDDLYVVSAFQIGQREMGGVRFSCRSGTAAGVVEVDDGLRAAGERFGRADILHAVAFPQTAAVAEGLQAAFRADARTGEDDAFFHGLFLVG